MTSTANIEPLTIRGSGLSRLEVLQLLKDAGVQLNAHAETLLAHPGFDAPARRILRIVERTVEQLAQMRVSKMTVYRLVRSGALHGIRFGRSYRVPETAVQQYLESVNVGH